MIPESELIAMKKTLSADEVDAEDILNWFAINGIDLLDEVLAFRREANSESKLPQLRCGFCDEELGIMGLHKSDEGSYVFVMPCTKCKHVDCKHEI